MPTPGGAVPGGAVPGGSSLSGAFSTSSRPFGFGVATSLSSRPFPFGAAQSYSTRPFGLLGPPMSSYSRRPFALSGPGSSRSVRPFALAGPALSLSRRPFRFEGPAPTQWGGYAPDAPAWGTTSLIAAAAIGATTIYVQNGTGFRAGQTLQLGTGTPFVTTVVSASGGTIVLADALPAALALGAPVLFALPASAPIPATTLSGSATAGATTITVTTAGAYQPGQPILIGTEVNVVASVSGSTITLQYPLIYSWAAGTSVATQSWGFVANLPVYDKAGSLLGNLTNVTVDGPPSREIGNVGAARFFLPVSDPSATLVYDDRLVLIQTEAGESPWVGTITVQGAQDGKLVVAVDDLFAILAGGSKITLEREVADDTNAALIYNEAMALHNANAVANGELTWQVDAQTTRPFRGDLDFEGDAFQLLQHIARRSNTEFIWTATASGSGIVATIVARDRIEVAGPLLHDTALDDTANIVDGTIAVTRDPTPIIQSIKLKGVQTDLASCLPGWARWAGHDLIPEVTLSVPAGDHRVREVEEVTVDWGLSHQQINQLCNQTLDTLWAMYYDFLKAIHDIEGRPYHPGFIYAGPTDYFETPESGADALSRRTWRTRRQLVETFPDTPAAAIMISDANTVINRAQWLIINYNRASGKQSIQYWGFPAVEGASMTQWHVDDGATFTLYFATGGRIYNTVPTTVTPGSTSGTGSFVESFNTRLYDPATGGYRYLRRILSGGYAFSANLVGFLDPADPDVALTDLGTGAGIDLGTLGQLIGKVYDFELYNIETWDPRRDGIGEYLTRETIFNGVLTTKPRWHRVPWIAQDGATTTLVSGISATETLIELGSVIIMPQADEVPFSLRLDDGIDREIVTVTALTGTLATVLRGQEGTTAVVHEAGGTATLIGGEVFDGFVFPYEWPEGTAYAQALLDKYSVARTLLSFRVAMARMPDHQLPVGSVCEVDIVSEGVSGYSGTARILGMSPDVLHGEIEVAIEYPYVEV